MKLENLFLPIRIGSTEIKNRIVMAPMHTKLEAINGDVSEALIYYFEERAKGEVGLIVSPFTMVSEDLKTATLGVFSDRFIPGISRLCQKVRSFGAKFILQIAHLGGKASTDFTGRKPVAPSSIESIIYPERPRELTKQEIEEMIEKFVQGARRAKEAGCDGVEVHGAHTYLIGQFISPHTNKREDEYGKNLEGRMRFPSAIVKGIKRVCGEDFIVGFKFSAHEHLVDGVDDKLAQRIAKWMEKQGIHYIHTSATSSTIPGFLDCDFPSVPSLYSPQGVLVKLAEKVKEVVDIPVIATGGITDPVYAESILKEGRADLVALGRALIADPQWALKARTGRKIRYCIKCNTCHRGLSEHLECTVNPTVGEERRFKMRKSPIVKKVIVVGAGPAGIQVALTASQRGHKVIVYEEKKEVGGKMVYASIPNFKPEIGRLLAYYRKSIQECPVELRLGKRITSSDELSEEKPDVVIIAVGAEPYLPPIPGREREGVFTVIELFEKKEKRLGKDILVVGAGLIGCEVSWYLASQGKSVRVIDVLDRDSILQDEHNTNRSQLIRSMEKAGVKILERRELKEITEKGAIVNKEDAKKEFIRVDNVIFASGFKPKVNLREAFAYALTSVQVYFIGDCVQPRKLLEAIHEGHDIAWKI